MNETIPSGIRLQRLIQNSHTDILNREKNNDRFMHLYHIGVYWVAFERSAYRLCDLFLENELSLFRVPEYPEYVVMASVPADEAEPYFSKHNVSGDGTYHKVRFDDSLLVVDYCHWHKVVVRSVLQ